MPVAGMRALVVCGTETVAGGHIMLVAMMVAPAVGGREDASRGWRGPFRYPDFTW